MWERLEPQADPRHPTVQRPIAADAAPAGVAGAVLAFIWGFPLFRIVPFRVPGEIIKDQSVNVTFDAAAAAAQIWKTDLRAAADRAAELKSFAGLLRQDPVMARAQHAKTAGLGSAYYFVRGRGKVLARDHNHIRVALDGAEPATVALRIGPVFGNTLRDGCGLLDVNAFPGLQEFNALAAELNAPVELNVLPALREK